MHQSSYSIVSRFRDLVEKHFPQGPIRLLDVGSYGVNGTYKEIFADSAKFLYTGLDVNPGPNVDYVPTDPYAWPELKDETFDVIISGQAFEHIEFPWLVIEEMKRTLKINGLICIVAPSRGPEHKYPVDCWRYYPDGFRALAKWAGLEVLESKTSWGPSGFSDGSDQWGDTFCILHKRDDTFPLRTTGQPAHLRVRGKAINSNNPLRLARQEAYYGFARQEIIDVIQKNNISSRRIIEIGCAGGATGKRLKEISAVEKYVGIELSGQAAQLAEQHLDHVIVGDIESMDLASEPAMAGGGFDLILALDVLEHMNNPWDVLASITEYLKPGGHVIASIPNVQNISVVRELLQGRWQYRDAGILDATHLRFFTLQEIPPMFAGAGLRMLSAQRVLNPRIDPAALREKGNELTLGNIHIRDLGREEMLNLYTYQYIAIAQKPQATGLAGTDAKVATQIPAVADEAEKELLIKGLTSIVILTFNQLPYTRECYESIKRHTPELHEIIFIDNGSKDGTIKWLLETAREDPTVSVIDNRGNLGFAKGCNQGIEASAGEYVLLLNNDVVVTEGWLSGLLECHTYAPSAGIIGPMTNSISGIQKVEDPSYDRRKLDTYAAKFRTAFRHRRIPHRRIVGFCMLFKKTLAEKTGLLDVAFGTGNFEDDDYCLRAELEGYKNYIAGDVFIHHYGSQSFKGNKVDYASAMSGNRKLFSEKWTGIDPKTPVGKSMRLIGVAERAEELYQKGSLDKAAGVYIAGIKQDPENEILYILLAAKLIDSKHFQNALEILDQFRGKDENVRVLALKGYCQEGLDNLQQASEFADKALSADPGSALVINLQGVIAYKKGDKAGAEALFEKAISADPGYGEPNTNIGVLNWSNGDQGRGLDMLERGFMLSPENSDSAALYHAVVTDLKVFQRGEAVFRNALIIYPNHRRISFLLVDLLLKQNKHEDAMTMVEDALVRLGVEDESMIAAALAVRDKIGPKHIDNKKKKATLSLCMIVKNEQKYLARCLNSVKDIADEMIVVDTGSTDRTRDIAGVFGAKITVMEWQDDFAAARNVSLEKASGDWILVLDGDEVLARKDLPVLEEMIRRYSGKRAAFSFDTRNYIRNVSANWVENRGEYPEEAGSGWYPSTKVRLFPNRPEIRFVNPVHELVEPSILGLNMKIKPSPAPVHHYGKLDQKKTLEKGKQYFLLGKEKLKKSGNDPRAVFELAVQANELGVYEDAVELWNLLVSLTPSDSRVYTNAVKSYAELGRLEEAVTYARKAVELNPSGREAVYHLGVALFYSGLFTEAVQFLEGYMQKDSTYPPVMAVLSLCCLASDRKDKGYAHIRRLRKMGFNYAEYITIESKKLLSYGLKDASKKLVTAALDTDNATMELIRFFSDEFSA